MPLFNPGVQDVILGNTSGTTALISSGTLTLAGGNNITLSQSGNVVTISGGAGGGGGSNTLGMSNLGNTSGTTGVVAGSAIRYVLAGGNNITLSQSLDAGSVSGTVTISAFNQSVQTQNNVDATLSGNTAGVLALVSSGTLSLAGGDNITLSQAGNAVTISGPNTVAGGAPTINYWNNIMGIAPSMSNFSTSVISSLYVFPLVCAGLAFPGNMTVNTLGFLLSYNFTVTNASTQAQSTTISLAFYTLNGNTLSLLNSGTTTWGFAANAGMSSNYNGGRHVTFVSSQFSTSLTFSQTNYWVGLIRATGGTSYPLVSILANSWIAHFTVSGTVGSTANTTALNPCHIPWYGGVYSAATTGFPVSITQNQLLNTGTAIFLVETPPVIYFNNQTATF